MYYACVVFLCRYTLFLIRDNPAVILLLVVNLLHHLCLRRKSICTVNTQDPALTLSQGTGEHPLCIREGGGLQQETWCDNLSSSRMPEVQTFTPVLSITECRPSDVTPKHLPCGFAVGRGHCWRHPSSGGGSYWCGPGEGMEYGCHSSDHQFHFSFGRPRHWLPAGVPHPPILAKVWLCNL